MIKVLSLFSGIGAFERALTNINIPFELVNYCEIDKYASKSYSLIHNVSEDLNLGDISKVDETKLPDFDLLTWGFPCTDISVAGRQLGIIKGETRSGLYYEGLRILENKQPKYSIIENVEQLTKPKFANEFKTILEDLERVGYISYWKIIDSSKFGIPQTRKRVFIVSIRKDINQAFKFPLGQEPVLKLADILDCEVPEKYNISKEKFKFMEFKKNYVQWDISGKGYNSQQDRAFYYDGLAGSLPATNGGNKCNIIFNYKHEDKEVAKEQSYLRRLTPWEGLRLMGFKDEDYKILKENNISDTQIFKMAGNSIVVNVLESILKNLLPQG